MERLGNGRLPLERRKTFGLALAIQRRLKARGTATEEDRRRRMGEQFKRYLEHSSRGTLTPEWRKFGRRHALGILEMVVGLRGC